MYRTFVILDVQSLEGVAQCDDLHRGKELCAISWFQQLNRYNVGGKGTPVQRSQLKMYICMQWPLVETIRGQHVAIITANCCQLCPPLAS